jgi:Family of unknown function (DUF5683)
VKKISHLLFFVLLAAGVSAQQQAAPPAGKKEKTPEAPKIYIPKDSTEIADSLRREKNRRVTRHSAFVPGWGQFDNRQPWKVPFIYAGLGITTYLFFDNKKIYNELKQAYIYRTDTIPDNDDDIPEEYQPLSDNSIRFYRDEYRKNVDYSVLAFIIVWGLNVVDATVFAHLRDFDVSDQISLRLNTPSYNPVNGQSNMGLTLNLKPQPKTLKPLPAR